MGKLELYQLVKYLPHELKCCWNKSKPYLLIGLRKGNESVNNDLWIWRDGSNFFTGYTYECKPILRPLSDLIIERDGKIDMVEIAKICTPVVSNPKCNISEYCIGVRFKDSEGDIMVLAYTFNMRCFGLHERPTGEFSLCCYQSEMFEYLFANHYDVYGLIEKGLAIDINTL